ncbi:MAG: DUF262 domain-containing protein [Spirochaetaceae bacterium]|nr:DUF262 domain-containing protein [Spirochaetaceae bacterium]
MTEIGEEVFDSSESEDDEQSTSVRYTITSYGADYPVDSLVKRLDRGDVYVPEFQRQFVWTHAQASRFIESLLLGLPVPGIFLFKEPDTHKLVVVDGQQRLTSLLNFYHGVIGTRRFALKGVDESIDGATYDTLDEESRRTLDDSLLHATVFQQDQPEGDRSSIYRVFERLNTGGTALAPQEIRSCVYRGPFNDLLQTLNEVEDWRSIYGPVSSKRKDQELILRFFALRDALSTYSKPLKQFLNDYMEEHAESGDSWLDEHREVFLRTVSCAARHLPRESFRPERSLNVAVTDAILIGLASRLERGRISDTEQLGNAAVELSRQQDFREVTDRSTTEAASISSRIRQATEAFNSVR